MSATEVKFCTMCDVLTERYSSGGCKPCQRARSAAYRKANPDKSKQASRRWVDANRELVKARGLNWARTNPMRGILKGAQRRARLLGIPFDLTADDLVVPDVCPVLNIPVTHGKGGMWDGSPTLDRIIPDKGYTLSNTRIISWRANRLKSDSTLDELRLVVSYIERETSAA